MRTSFQRLLKAMLFFLMALACVLCMERSSIAASRFEGSRLKAPRDINHRDTEIAEIMSVLGDKVESAEVAEKLKDKVLTLSDKQTRLLASLARLTAKGDEAIGAEIVFFVMTVLIIVS